MFESLFLLEFSQHSPRRRLSSNFGIGSRGNENYERFLNGIIFSVTCFAVGLDPESVGRFIQVELTASGIPCNLPMPSEGHEVIRRAILFLLRESDFSPLKLPQVNTSRAYSEMCNLLGEVAREHSRLIEYGNWDSTPLPHLYGRWGRIVGRTDQLGYVDRLLRYQMYEDWKINYLHYLYRRWCRIFGRHVHQGNLPMRGHRRNFRSYQVNNQNMIQLSLAMAAPLDPESRPPYPSLWRDQNIIQLDPESLLPNSFESFNARDMNATTQNVQYLYNPVFNIQNITQLSQNSTNGDGQRTLTMLGISAQVALMAVTAWVTSKNTLSEQQKILIYFAVGFNGFGVLTLLFGVAGTKPGIVRIANKTGICLAAFGFIAIMGLILHDSIMLWATGLVCLIYFPALACAY